jgi:hypothetical protein
MHSFRWLTLTALVGCTLGADLPEGRILCTTQADCPPDWFCRPSDTSGEGAGLCYRSDGSDEPMDGSTPQDGGPVVDAGSHEAGSSEHDGAVIGRDGAVDGRDGAAGELDGAAGEPDGAAGKPDGGGTTDAAVVGQPPVISGLALLKRRFNPGESANLTCLASDPDGDSLSYLWSAGQGSYAKPTQRATSFTAGAVGADALTCTVDDGHGNRDRESVDVRVYPAGWLSLLSFPLDSIDKSGHGNDAIVEGGVYSVDRAGHPSSSIELAGSGHITLDNEAAFDLEAWSFVVTLRAAPGHGGTIVTKAEGAFGAFTLFLYADDAGSFPGRLQYYQQGADSTPYAIFLGDYTAPKNQFFQLAVTRSKTGQLRAYVDGNLIHTHDNLPTPVQNDAPVVLGSGALGAFWGVMDEVQLYERVLSASEVKALVGMQ